MTIPSPSRRRALRSGAGRFAVAAVLPAALLVTGCGSAAPRPQVASLPHPAHARTTKTTATSTAANEGIPDPDGRPRQGLDQNSQQDYDTLYDPYYHCVYHGHRIPPKSNTAAYRSALTRAVAACIRLDPLPPWQLDPSNPQSRAFIGRTVTCMRAKGYRVEAELDSGYIINSPEWTVQPEGSLGSSSAQVTSAMDQEQTAQFRCQDQVRRESSG